VLGKLAEMKSENTCDRLHATVPIHDVLAVNELKKFIRLLLESLKPKDYRLCSLVN
jgi:hypothetical protein